jgi:putative DNA primase/helicase
MTAEQLAHALGAVRSGRQWKCRCVAHEDRSPSMIIFDGHDSVQVRCMAGCEPADIIFVLRSRGLWAGVDNFGHGWREKDKKSVSHETVAADRREQQMRLLARCTFDDAVPLSGTLAEKYFDSRDLWSVARETPDIRFHPRCPREKSEQPAVVIAMRSISSNAITAVQRIFLTRQGRKDGKPMMLGSVSGAAMKLQPLDGRKLNIAEGLETALGVIALDRRPVWALGSTSLMQTFRVLADIDKLVIWADHDQLRMIGGKPCRPGEKAANICRARWIAAGKQIDVFEPIAEGEDAADEWSKRCARL